MTTPADWYPDPADSSRLRYWDGTAWTDHRAPAKRRPRTAAEQTPAEARLQVRFAVSLGFVLLGVLLTVILAATGGPWWIGLVLGFVGLLGLAGVGKRIDRGEAAPSAVVVTPPPPSVD